MYPQCSPVVRPSFRLDILLTRALTVFQKILAQPNQAKKKTKPGSFPTFRHGPPDVSPRFVSARGLTCIKNVGRPGPIPQVAMRKPLLTTTAIVLRVLGIVPLDRRYHLSFTENHLDLGQAFSPPRKIRLSHLVIV